MAIYPVNRRFHDQGCFNRRKNSRTRSTIGRMARDVSRKPLRFSSPLPLLPFLSTPFLPVSQLLRLRHASP